MKKKIVSLLLCLILLVSVLPSFAEGSGSEADLVAALLAGQAAGQTDPWVLAILEAGAKEVAAADGAMTFRLRSFNPNLKALGAYAKADDPAAWRQGLFAQLSAWDLEISLPMTADGGWDKKAASTLLNKVKSAAKAAKAELSKKDVASALTDLLFCSPTDAKKVSGSNLLTVTDAFSAFILARPEVYPCESPAEWAPLFYAQRNRSYSMKNGPHSIVLSWDGVDVPSLLNTAYDDAVYQLASVPAAERVSAENLPTLWRGCLANASVSLFSQKLATHSATFDLDALMAGTLPEGYLAYINSYTPADMLLRLTAAKNSLPEGACQSFPKTAVNTAAARGRGVTVSVPKSGRNTYVQLRDADTGVIRGDAWIQPGKNVTIKVPEGNYIIQYASGSAWYGQDGIFGLSGEYTASSAFTIGKQKLTLTANQNSDSFVLHEAFLEDFAAIEDVSVWIKGALEPQTPLFDSYPGNNPVVEGVSSTTGLPSSGEVYTPIVVVLDNAEDAYPHWGVSQADIIFQVPNAGSGATKLLGLFADHYPEEAGPVRSGRASMLPVAMSFDAAFAFAGPPAVSDAENVDLEALLKVWKLSANHRAYNLLSGKFATRISSGTFHNMTCHLGAIHQDLIKDGVTFEERPFLFTDEPRTDGEIANNVRVLHRGENSESGSNSASRAVFNYDETTGQYSRINSSGLYTDRDNGENVPFANVIVLRVKFGWEAGYVYLDDHLVGSGCAEIFQNGRYVRGAWLRTALNNRLILTDADGSELKLQRGKTFIIITNDITDVIYSR